MRLTSLALVALLSLAACRGTEPPYSPGQEPLVEDLLAAATPKLTSIQVPRAKVRQGGGPAASLMMLAQHPDRFAGTIQISGNELVSLAVNEESYGLRWIGRGDAGLDPGYYSGPPSRCAVEALLGVDLEPEAFVDLVLGGAPIIDEPHQVVDRHWDRKQARELLTIANDRYQQQLQFAWSKGEWQFAGATLWRLEGDSKTWLWSVLHGEMHRVGDQMLPRKTEIRQPKAKGRGDLVIEVTYEKQVANPGFGEIAGSDPPAEGEPENADDQWDEGGDEGWDDEGGWDDESGGDESGSAPEPEPETKPPAKPTIPAQFLGKPQGLTARGDLCAGR
ncbi:hypothetical protein ACNOYE_11190 [Nannocystaceae bacterium ST9]